MGFLTCRLFREGCSDTVTLYLGEELSGKKQAVQRSRGRTALGSAPGTATRPVWSERREQVALSVDQ